MNEKKTKKPIIQNVSILTFSNNINYGGTLQEFALYKVVAEKYNAICIDYLDDLILMNKKTIRSSFLKKTFYLLFSLISIRKTTSKNPKSKTNQNKYQLLKKIIKSSNLFFTLSLKSIYTMFSDIFNIKQRIQLINNFDSFWNHYLKRTTPLSKADLKFQKINDFDVCILGSDQVWNPIITGFDEIYFLDFIKSKKISYASSFGRFDFSDLNQVELIKKYLIKFTHISIREKSGVDYLHNVCDIHSTLTLDPTLLYSKEQWLKLLSIDITNHNVKYLLLYTLTNRNSILPLAEIIAKELGLKIYILDSCLFDKFNKNRVYHPSAGPIEFIKLFAEASFVITNSFHGTAFSINFNVPFYSIKSHQPERALSLLEMVGLQEKFINHISDIKGMDYTNINFKHANNILNKERINSKNYLYNAIEN